MDERWVLSIRDQCASAGVPFFFKQWGGVIKSRKGRLLEGKTYDEYPRIVAASPPSTHERARRMTILHERFDNGAIAAE
jgi:hypothetical protein